MLRGDSAMSYVFELNWGVALLLAGENQRWSQEIGQPYK